jgi:hypothetical protein
MNFNLVRSLLLAGCVVMLLCRVSAQMDYADDQKAFAPQHESAGQELPPGVPRVVDTNGKVIYIPHEFTSELYQNEALELLIGEANHVAMDLKLPEELPIGKSNLTEYSVSPFGFGYGEKSIGFVSTRNYTYYVARGNKFNQLSAANYDQTCFKLAENGKLPIALIDTNAAYKMATQWLAAASIDVVGLNRDYRAHVAASPFWNGLAHLGETPQKQFVPIYFVWWNISESSKDGQGSVADVELYSSSNKLLQMSVGDAKYILRKPLEFTNLAVLFPGTAPIRTNHPAETIYMSAPSN